MPWGGGGHWQRLLLRKQLDWLNLEEEGRSARGTDCFRTAMQRTGRPRPVMTCLKGDTPEPLCLSQAIPPADPSRVLLWSSPVLGTRYTQGGSQTASTVPKLSASREDRHTDIKGTQAGSNYLCWEGQEWVLRGHLITFRLAS